MNVCEHWRSIRTLHLDNVLHVDIHVNMFLIETIAKDNVTVGPIGVIYQTTFHV